MRRERLPVEEYVDGVLRGDRGLLARAITLVESRLESDQELAQQVLERVLPHTGGSVRVGVSGAPGVGKSTLLETLGAQLCDRGHQVAVLAIDPTSRISGGSILGDKSRMHRLAQHAQAFVRPSPAAETLGGVARRTREALLLCEAAGFDVVIVETVGVGQSETAVADMVDTFVVLLEPGAGDELQGIKRGILELAHIVAITKADGDNAQRARASQREYGAAMRYLVGAGAAWVPPVTTVSALSGEGIGALWEKVLEHRRSSGDGLRLSRAQQNVAWMWSEVEALLLWQVRSRIAPAVVERLEAAVRAATRSPTAAARELVAALRD